jgi:hypothetical protein
MRNHYHTCLFCGKLLDEESDQRFSSLRKNVCPSCWDVTLQRTEPGILTLRSHEQKHSADDSNYLVQSHGEQL